MGLDDVRKRSQRCFGLLGGVSERRILKLRQQRQPVFEHKQIVRLQFVSLPQRLNRLRQRRLARRHRSQQVEVVPDRSRLRREFARAFQRHRRVVDLVRADRDACVEYVWHMRVRLNLGQQFQRPPGFGEHFRMESRLARHVDDSKPQLPADRQIARSERVVGSLPDDVTQQFVGLGEFLILQQRNRSIPLVEQFDGLFPSQLLRGHQPSTRPTRLRVDALHDEDKDHKQ